LQAEKAQEQILAEGPPPDMRVHITRTTAGGVQFDCPPSRNLSMTVGLLIFTAIWTGAIYLMVRHGVPIIFPIVFGLFQILMILGLLGIWTSKSRLVIENSMMRVHSSFLGISSKAKEFHCREISNITSQVGMQSGSKVFYRIKIETNTGQSANFGSGIPSSNAVDWLIAKIKDEIEKQAR
jgi:hypothetical protein